jgi:hypothetical protein
MNGTMDTYFVSQWNKNAWRILNWFKTTPQSEYNEYEKIVKKLFELVINDDDNDHEWSWMDMTTLDHGSWQGTQIFIVHKSTYQPGVTDYVMTHNEYGSCSGCDTLEAIRVMNYDDDLPTQSQLNDYMTLCLHLVQRMKRLSGDEVSCE